MTTELAPTDDDLRAIAEQVWSSYLDPEGVSPLLPLAAVAGDGHVSATVSVTGAWWGHVVIRCSKDAARNAAAALLGVEQADATTDDVADAVGELANIIGGNVKSLLPGPCALSLPSVLLSGELSWPDVVQICQLHGSWQGESVQIRVLAGTVE